MIKKIESTIIVDGVKRSIDITLLQKLAKKHLPSGMAAEYKNKFVKEVAYRLSGSEFTNVDFNGTSAEEYFFAACLAYAKNNSFNKLFNEKDDNEVLYYCGNTL